MAHTAVKSKRVGIEIGTHRAVLRLNIHSFQCKYEMKVKPDAVKKT